MTMDHLGLQPPVLKHLLKAALATLSSHTYWALETGNHLVMYIKKFRYAPCDLDERFNLSIS